MIFFQIGFRLISIHGENSKKQKAEYLNDDVIERIMAGNSRVPSSFLQTQQKKQQDHMKGVAAPTRLYGKLRDTYFRIRNVAFPKNEESQFVNVEDIDLPYERISGRESNMWNLPFAKFKHLGSIRGARESMMSKEENIDVNNEESQMAPDDEKSISMAKFEQLVPPKEGIMKVESSDVANEENSMVTLEKSLPFKIVSSDLNKAEILMAPTADLYEKDTGRRR